MSEKSRRITRTVKPTGPNPWSIDPKHPEWDPRPVWLNPGRVNATAPLEERRKEARKLLIEQIGKGQPDNDYNRLQKMIKEQDAYFLIQAPYVLYQGRRMKVAEYIKILGYTNCSKTFSRGQFPLTVDWDYVDAAIKADRIMIEQMGRKWRKRLTLVYVSKMYHELVQRILDTSVKQE